MVPMLRSKCCVTPMERGEVEVQRTSTMASMDGRWRAGLVDVVGASERAVEALLNVVTLVLDLRKRGIHFSRDVSHINATGL